MKLLILPFLLITNLLLAQEQETNPGKIDFGTGLGLDYGGIGIRATYKPISKLGLFGAFGYNLDALGYNVGGQLYFTLKNQQFYFTGMYGYNGVIIVTGDIKDKATYYGITTGLGYQLFIGQARRNFFNFELLVPFRDQSFKDDLNALKEIGADVRDALPIAICVGYHIQLK